MRSAMSSPVSNSICRTNRLEVLAEVGVEVRKARGATDAESAAWEEVRGALNYSGRPMSAVHLDACRFRMESSYVRIKQTFSDYAADCFAQGRPLLLAAEDLMHKIHRDFSYAAGRHEHQHQGVEEPPAFTAPFGRRVCLPGFRPHHAGLPALFGSGGPLRQRLSADHAGSRLPMLPCLGADASHAWVSVFCPP